MKATLAQALLLLATTSVAAAEESPKPKDDSAVKLGTTIFADYTYQASPLATDADKNQLHASSFEVRRAYVNVAGAINSWISFRVTPDVATRQTLTTSAIGLPGGASVTTTGNLDGSLVVRLKYAYGQFSLDKPLKSKTAWVRLGQQPTPYLDGMESVYRYRFQGTMFLEREGFISSSDVGLSARYAFPREYGDVHAGFYNGDSYAKAEANDRKAFQVRGSVRPLPKRELLKGVRLHAFYVADAPIQGGVRDRFAATLSFEHRHLNLGFEYLDAKDGAGAGKPQVTAKGWSLWATPRTRYGIEGLLRYDELKPNQSVDAKKSRLILGAAYWFREKLPLAAALMVDFEQVHYDSLLAKPTEKRYGLKAYFAY